MDTTPTTPTTSLEQFLRQRSELLALCEHLLPVLETLNLPALYNEVRHLRQRLESETLKVLVMGEGNRGKSTVINALLRQKLLPAYPVPTTGVRCEVKWGQQPGAMLHYRPAGDGSRRQPRNVPLTEIETYLVLDGDNEKLPEYERIEVFSPLAPCEAGIEIIDTAGPFSVGPYDDDGLPDMTIAGIASMDAVLFVFGCDALPSKEESLQIDWMRCAGQEAIFFVCNRFDLVEPSGQAMVKRRFLTHLGRLTPYGEQNVFFTNAKGALAGYLKPDLEQVRRSNMPQVEEVLFDFLLQQRGKGKFTRCAIELKTVVRRASSVLPTKRLLLQMEEEALRVQRVQVDRRLDQLEEIQQRIYMLLTVVRHTMKSEVKVVAARFYLKLIPQVENWVQRYMPGEPSSTWDVFVGDAPKRLVKELTAFLTTEVQAEFQAWTESVLQELLFDRLSGMTQGLYRQCILFVSELAQARHEVLGRDDEYWGGSEEAMLKRVFGSDEGMADAFAPLATTVAKRGSFIWHPLALIAILLKNERIQTLMREEVNMEALRSAVGQEYRRELEVSLEQRADAIAEIVDNELSPFQEELEHVLDLELHCVRDLVRAGVEELQQGDGKHKMDVALRLLESLENELLTIDRELEAHL